MQVLAHRRIEWNLKSLKAEPHIYGNLHTQGETQIKNRLVDGEKTWLVYAEKRKNGLQPNTI